MDSELAVLEAVVENNGAPYLFSVDWGDGTEPDTATQAASELTLTHDYDHISTFRVTLEVRLVSGPDLEIARVEPPSDTVSRLVTVSDDDDDVPLLVWNLPPSVIGPGEPAVVGWQVTDDSGLDFVSVVIQGPNGPIARFSDAQGSFDVGGRGLGVFGIELQTRDRDLDRPGDDLGYMVIESVVVTADLDEDGILDYLDNCPDTANPDELDSDGDGLGDACDECPEINASCEGPPVPIVVRGPLLQGIPR